MKNILIAGVGGQGTILAGRIISLLALETGHEVKVSEIHGMSQRGGSVVTQVRYGAEVHAPLVTPGQADILLAFEKLEALRLLPLLKPEGLAVVNTQEIMPMPVLLGAMEYPADIDTRLAGVTMLNALALAQQAGSAKAVNTVLLGKLSQSMEFGEDEWLNAIASAVKPQFVELNKQAFLLGRGA